MFYKLYINYTSNINLYELIIYVFFLINYTFYVYNSKCVFNTTTSTTK